MTPLYVIQPITCDGTTFVWLPSFFEFLATSADLPDAENYDLCEKSKDEFDRYMSNKWKTYRGMAKLADYFATQCERLERVEALRRPDPARKRYTYFEPFARNFIIEIEKLQNILLN